jgi:hypothetical protein
MQRKVITIQNSEAIVRRDINDNGWYVLGIKKGYDSYYLNITQSGFNKFKTCQLSRKMNEAGLYILRCGTEYCTLTKSQVGDMNYLLICLQSFVS